MEATHRRCPYPACGSSDAFSYNTDKKVGKCHSCNRDYPSRDEMFPWAKEEYPVNDMKKIEGEPYWKRKAHGFTQEGIRGLSKATAELYNIAAHLDEAGDVFRYSLKWPSGVQYRKVNEDDYGPKYHFKDQGYKLDEFFGPDFNAGTAKRIYLTEGAFDAASLYEAINTGSKFNTPVKAIPSATSREKFLSANKDRNYKYLDSFQEIVYAGELDKSGRECADFLYSVFPHKMFFVPMTKHKDANEFLMNGDKEDLKWAALKPQRYSPENFYIGDNAIESAITTENPYQYYPTGHTELDSMIRGMVKGGLTFIKAPRGSGKTEIARFFEMGLIRDHDVTVAMLHMEEQKSTTYRCMATYELGINVRTKDDAANNGISESDVIAAAKRAAKDSKTILFEMRGSDDPLKLLDYARLAATVYGAEFVFVDHAQRLAYLSETGVDGATSVLTTLASRGAQLCKELNIGIVFLSQVNEDGRTKYAGSLEEEAIICIKLERDVESEDEVERNTTNFIVDKNRPFSKLGQAGALFWDGTTTILEEA